jgi:hypothetical protein
LVGGSLNNLLRKWEEKVGKERKERKEKRAVNEGLEG